MPATIHILTTLLLCVRDPEELQADAVHSPDNFTGGLREVSWEARLSLEGP